MTIAVIGAGAIGNLVAGYLKLKGASVTLVGSNKTDVDIIRQNGIKISGIRGESKVRIQIEERLSYVPDLAILATKTQDLDSALTQNSASLQNSTILTTQNGVQADGIVAKYLRGGDLISSIIMFGATYLKPGEVVHNFEGSWIIGRLCSPNDNKVVELSHALEDIFPIIVAEDLKGMKYLKIFVNTNNCIPAILGVSMQEAFSDPQVSRISIGIWKEGLAVVTKAGINLVSLPDFPVDRINSLTSIATDKAAGVLSGIMTGLSKEPVYGSILQSIKRGRPSEIDYINGEFLNLAKMYDIEAPLNKRIVEMVHEVEKTKRFFTKEELLNNTKGLFN